MDYYVDKVLHIFESDAFSVNYIDGSNIFNRQVNRIMTSYEIVFTSNDISEIQIVNKIINGCNDLYETMNPSYIVVYDEPSLNNVLEAKRLGIPIVITRCNYMEKCDNNDIRYAKWLNDYVYTFDDVKDRKCLSRF